MAPSHMLFFVDCGGKKLFPWFLLRSGTLTSAGRHNIVILNCRKVILYSLISLESYIFDLLASLTSYPVLYSHFPPHVSCQSRGELTSRENGAARSLHLVENRRKHFLPSSTAAVRNDSVRPEKTGTLFLFSSESSSVLWVYAGLHEVSMNAAFPPAPCAWNSDPRVQSSFILSCFLLLIIPALAGRAPRSEL